ncbi:cytochrome P450 [Pelomonas sp. SE-A7]|uniref:cytochrome P450 n=1 Tax=Pelomonas sp. SE-A7 TaxID=3054953 RepID=UPI00259CEA4D|nr:cytochrome P450 [Pelomonas sp. SE-A7]MDM4767029.1 cytochrome P450 [Pelomonas sp. SE-A7]
MEPLHYDDLPSPANRWLGLSALSDMSRDYLGLLTRLKQEQGDMVRLPILSEKTLDLFDPELVRRLMVEHADALIRWERGTEVFSESVGQSVLVTEGATWQRQRRLLMQAFTPRKVAGYAALMAEAGEAGLSELQPGIIAMDGLFSRLTMDVISRTLFSRPIGPNTDEAAAAVQRLSEIGLREMFWPATLPDWLPLPGKAGKRRALALINGLLHERINERRHSGEQLSDLLGMLLSVRDDEGGGALSEQEVFDQCMLSFQAGHETSATALLWWSWLMARHPEAQQRAADEVAQALAGRTPVPEEMVKLPWLTATLKEAMRLYPPAAALLTRRLTRDVDLTLNDGRQLRIPRRTMVRITPWLLHRDPRSWPEGPDEFRPERFLPGAPHEIPRGAYLPFGQGPRVCLGQHFAMLEMQILAAQLLQRWRLRLVDGEPEPVPRLAVTLRPAGGLRLRLEAAA